MPRWISLLGCLAWAGMFQSALAQDSPSQLTCSPPEAGQGLGVVTGIVREAETQVPMGYVDVRLIPGSNDMGGLAYLTRGAPNGRFQFCDVPAGTYTIQGWFDQIGGDLTQVSVGPGGETSLTLNLGMGAESDDPGSLSGQVVDAQSGDPIEGATVRLAKPRRQTISDAEGAFAFPSLSPDTFDLEVIHLGHEDIRGTVVVGGAQAVTVRVTMATQAIALEPIEVTATRRELGSALPGMEQLDRRMKAGFGEFILPDQIKARNPSKVTDLLTGSSVLVMNNGEAIYMGRTRCAPLVYIDDVRITHGYGSGTLVQGGTRSEPAMPPGIDAGGDEGSFAAEAVNLIHPTNIQGIEIYQGPGSTPGQYLDSRARCGVILIWTRRGPRG